MQVLLAMLEALVDPPNLCRLCLQAQCLPGRRMACLAHPCISLFLALDSMPPSPLQDSVQSDGHVVSRCFHGPFTQVEVHLLFQLPATFGSLASASTPAFLLKWSFGFLCSNRWSSEECCQHHKVCFSSFPFSLSGFWDMDLSWLGASFCFGDWISS